MCIESVYLLWIFEGSNLPLSPCEWWNPVHVNVYRLWIPHWDDIVMHHGCVWIGTQHVNARLLQIVTCQTCSLSLEQLVPMWSQRGYVSYGVMYSISARLYTRVLYLVCVFGPNICTLEFPSQSVWLHPSFPPAPLLDTLYTTLVHKASCCNTALIFHRWNSVFVSWFVGWYGANVTCVRVMPHDPLCLSLVHLLLRSTGTQSL